MTDAFISSHAGNPRGRCGSAPRRDHPGRQRALGDRPAPAAGGRAPQGRGSGARDRRACARPACEYLTLFAFSPRTGAVPPRRCRFLMRLFMSRAAAGSRPAPPQRHPLRVVGDLVALRPAQLQRLIAAAEALTADNGRMTLTIAANYGGRWDILQARRRCCATGCRGADLGRAGHRGANSRRTSRCATRPSPTSSSAPAANSGSATSCSGSSRTPSCTSASATGRTSTPAR